jgi:hypothetical protein
MHQSDPPKEIRGDRQSHTEKLGGRTDKIAVGLILPEQSCRRRRLGIIGREKPGETFP